MNMINILKATLGSTTLLATALFSSSLQARPSVPACSASQSITHNFSSGAAWDLCWEERAEEGIVLTRIAYQTPDGTKRQVLGEAALSQLLITPDDGSPARHVVTDTGLGGDNLLSLTPAECPGGTLINANDRPTLCRNTASMGYVYKYYTQQQQGSMLELSSVSKSNGLNFIVRWQFLESGDIHPILGITGNLTDFTSNANEGWPITSDGELASGLSFNIYWKLDFDLGGTSNNDIAQQINSAPNSNRRKKTLSKTTLSSEQALSTDYENKAFWRVMDQSLSVGSGRPISYELQPMSFGQRNAGATHSYTRSDVFFTQYKSCERFAVQNPTSNCAGDVSGFINNQSINSKDIVMWYRQGYHLLPRNEDENMIGTHWNSFTITPRDWNSSNPLI